VRSIIHEIRNHLAVAIANVEAFRDGILGRRAPRRAAIGTAPLGYLNLTGLMHVPVASDRT
jgi:hypothetical protein